MTIKVWAICRESCEKGISKGIWVDLSDGYKNCRKRIDDFLEGTGGYGYALHDYEADFEIDLEGIDLETLCELVECQDTGFAAEEMGDGYDLEDIYDIMCEFDLSPEHAQQKLNEWDM